MQRQKIRGAERTADFREICNLLEQQMRQEQGDLREEDQQEQADADHTQISGQVLQGLLHLDLGDAHGDEQHAADRGRYTGIRMGATMMVADRVSMNIPTISRKITSRIMITYLLEVSVVRKFTMMVGTFA